MGQLEDAHYSFRCTATANGRRCQLYAGHDTVHAAAELGERDQGYRRRGGRAYRWTTVCWVWGDDGVPVERTIDDLRGRVTWCALFAG